jgi:ABC-type phosphate transport system substrate-binding protein
VTARARLILAALVALAIAGCGGLDEGGEAEQDDTLTTPEEQAAEEGGRPAQNQQDELPPRPPGVVDVAGRSDASLTLIFTEGDASAGTEGFTQSAAGSGLNIQPNVQLTDEAAGFVDLCEGRVDIVDSSREIAPEEVERCERNGLQLVEFQVGYDAAVLATRNEKDVGADCVSMSDLRDTFEAGSTIEAWNQIQPFFFPVRLDTAGPDEQSSDFDFVFSRMLGIPDPSLADLREDYQASADERDVKNAVAREPKGVLGIVGFSFYGLHEDKLRPLEIDGETGDSCVFPSEETIVSLLYPFARGLRLYTTTRGLQRAEVREFIRSFIERAQDLALRNDFLALPDPVRQVQIRRIDNPTALADEALRDENGVIIAARLPVREAGDEEGAGTGSSGETEAGGAGGTGQGADAETPSSVPAPGTSGTIAEQRAPDAAGESSP